MKLISAVLLLSSAIGFAQTPTPATPPPATLAIMPAPSGLPALIPMPREVKITGSLPLTAGVHIEAITDAENKFTVQDLTTALEERGVHTTSSIGDGVVTVALLSTTSPAAQADLKSAGLTFSPEMETEGYVLLCSGKHITIIAASKVGLFYGAQTLKQLIETKDGKPVLNTATIRDWPAMKFRGIDDDLSRGPVPTLEYQKRQIRTVAAYKINVYSPYFESNFAYASDPLVGLPDGAMTPADARELVAYAAKYHVIIIPEQEGFGHIHHIMLWEQYSKLAETPYGNVLAPGQPGSLDAINSWFSQLAAVFPAPYLHIGADETFDLGLGQTKADVDARGLDAVYLDFITNIHNRLLPLHRRLLFWGDIAVHSPELIKKLPPDMIHDMVAVPWRYGVQTEGFDKDIKPFTDAGMETWVAPGVSNWSRVWPDNNTALLNIQGFTRDGQRLGAVGQLNTVWDDDGEGLFEMNWYGVLFGAAAAWQPGESSIPQFEQSFGQVFHGDTSGKINQAQLELMAAHSLLSDVAKVGDGNDSLFWVDPWSPQGQLIAAKIRPVLHDLRMHSERAISLIAEARDSENLREVGPLKAMDMGARRMDFIGLKFELADQMVLDYQTAFNEQHQREKRSEVGHMLSVIDSTNGYCQDIRDSYSLTRDLYEQVWLSENRPYWLHNVLALYDQSTQLWLSRIDKLNTIKRQWATTHTIPPASEIGLPSELATIPSVK